MFKKLALTLAFVTLLSSVALAQELPKPDDRYAGYPVSLITWPKELPDLAACQAAEYYGPSDIHLLKYVSRVKGPTHKRIREFDECGWALTVQKGRYVMRPKGSEVIVDEQGRDLFDAECGNPNPFNIPIIPPPPAESFTPPPPPPPVVQKRTPPVPQFGRLIVTKICVKDREGKKRIDCPTDWQISFVAKQVGNDEVLGTAVAVDNEATFRLRTATYSVTESNLPKGWTDITGSVLVDVMAGKTASRDYVNMKKGKSHTGLIVGIVGAVVTGIVVAVLTRGHHNVVTPQTKCGGSLPCNPGGSPQ